MELQFVVFTLAGEDFGIAIEQVREIVRYVPVTALPMAPRGVRGVINLRGGVIPIVSLRERFGFAEEAESDATRIVVTDVAGETVGFVVDAVTEVLRLEEGAIEPPPETAASVGSSFIQGIGKLGERLIIVLDLAKVFDFGSVKESS